MENREKFDAWWFNGGQDIATNIFHKEAEANIKRIIERMPKVLHDNSYSDNQLESQQNNIFWDEVERLAFEANLHLDVKKLKSTRIPESWKTSKREDLSQAHKLINLGFSVEYSRGDVMHSRCHAPHDGITFKTEHATLWKVRDWIYADLIDGFYCNHKHFESIEKFIEKFIEFYLVESKKDVSLS